MSRSWSNRNRHWHRLRVVPHFSSGIVGRAKRERARKSPHARKGDTPSLTLTLHWKNANSLFKQRFCGRRRRGILNSLLKGLGHAISYLKVFKKLKLDGFKTIEFPNKVVQFCQSRPFSCIETFSCCLLQRMATLDTDWNLKKLSQSSQVLKELCHEIQPN